MSIYICTASRWNHIENLDEFFDRVSVILAISILIFIKVSKVPTALQSYISWLVYRVEFGVRPV